MNENDSPPEPLEQNPPQDLAVVPKAPEPFVNFEWHEQVFGSRRDEYGEPELVETIHQVNAAIQEPQPGEVIQEPHQAVVRWCHPHEGRNYVVLKHEGGYVALRSDVALRPREATRVELRAVTLDGPQPTLGWEVYAQSPHGGWEPVEGQHLHPRTAPAGQWLEELENIVLPKLTAQRTELVAQYHKASSLSPVACHPEGRPLNYDAALSLSRNAVLGCNYDDAHAAAYSAELHLTTVANRLREHLEKGQRLGLAAYQPWVAIPRWQQSFRLHGRVKRATADWTEAVTKVRELQEAAESPKVSASIEQGAKNLLAAQKFKREADRAVRKVAEAQQLVTQLRQRPGALITLEQTLIQGRRAQTVPKWQAAELLSPRFNQAAKIHAHSRRF